MLLLEMLLHGCPVAKGGGAAGTADCNADLGSYRRHMLRGERVGLQSGQIAEIFQTVQAAERIVFSYTAAASSSTAAAVPPAVANAGAMIAPMATASALGGKRFGAAPTRKRAAGDG